MILYKEYRKLEDKEIKFLISFNKDSVNWATSQPKKIGYHVTVMPVKELIAIDFAWKNLVHLLDLIIVY